MTEQVPTWWIEEDDEDGDIEIGEHGCQVAHNGYLRCVSCGENVTVDKIIYHKRPGDWTKEFCPSCYKIMPVLW
jgi:hypothetical protein